MKKTLITLLGIVLCGAAVAVEKPAGATMEQYVDALMRRMTLEEKIGQLNLPSAGDITTGQAKSSDIAEKIRRGEVGGLFNIKGVEKIRDVQRIAVEESRLGIPLIFGMDVIHGYETTLRPVFRPSRRVPPVSAGPSPRWSILRAIPAGDVRRRASAKIPSSAALWRGRSSTAIRGVIRCILPPTRSWDA